MWPSLSPDLNIMKNSDLCQLAWPGIDFHEAEVIHSKQPAWVSITIERIQHLCQSMRAVIQARGYVAGLSEYIVYIIPLLCSKHGFIPSQVPNYTACTFPDIS